LRFDNFLKKNKKIKNLNNAPANRGANPKNEMLCEKIFIVVF
jgi:hypothetical protein